MTRRRWTKTTSRKKQQSKKEYDGDRVMDKKTCCGSYLVSHCTASVKGSPCQSQRPVMAAVYSIIIRKTGCSGEYCGVKSLLWPTDATEKGLDGRRSPSMPSLVRWW